MDCTQPASYFAPTMSLAVAHGSYSCSASMLTYAALLRVAFHDVSDAGIFDLGTRIRDAILTTGPFSPPRDSLSRTPFTFTIASGEKRRHEPYATPEPLRGAVEGRALTLEERRMLPADGILSVLYSGVPPSDDVAVSGGLYHGATFLHDKTTKVSPGTTLLRLGGVHGSVSATVLLEVLRIASGVQPVGLVMMQARVGFAVVRLGSADDVARVQQLDGRLWFGPDRAMIAVTSAAQARLMDLVATARASGAASKFPRHLLTVAPWSDEKPRGGFPARDFPRASSPEASLRPRYGLFRVTGTA